MGAPFIAGLILTLAASAAAAAEIKVISGGAARAFVEPLAAGQPAGMVIVTQEVLGELEEQARLACGTGQPIARVGIGVAVRETAPLPDISTPQAFRQALLAARSIVYIDPRTGTSGKHVALPVKGVKLVGELPRELQKYTVYVAAPVPSTANRAAVDAFIAHLRGREARERVASAGYTAPE